jgi:hypothetical protein
VPRYQEFHRQTAKSAAPMVQVHEASGSEHLAALPGKSRHREGVVWPVFPWTQGPFS